MWFKFIVVGVKAGEKGRTAEVFLKYRGNESPFHVPDQQLAAFCLPLGPDSQSQKERMSHEEYTFTLTQGDGNRVQGFCRRFLPPAPLIGSKLRFPQVLCLVCEAAWSMLFFKVLEAVEQLLRQTDLLLDFNHRELPAESYAGQFLSNLAAALVEQPQLGTVIRLKLPAAPTPLAMSPPKRVLTATDTGPLQLTSELLELQVPPDCGNGVSNAGISLARLLWHVPVPAMLTLIASLLLERRVLVVGQSRDMVSAAVAAAGALIYPFQWHHIYLPLLPRTFKDYLTAPMPFLIGMPAQLLPTLKGIPMDEVTLIDLDLGRCEPSAGSARDDAMLLPWREQLEAALHAVFGMLRSPTEHESNPLITNIMQGYFLKLLGGYRSHIYPEGVFPTPPGSNSLSHSPSQGNMHHSASAGLLGALSPHRESSSRGLGSMQSPRNSVPSPRDGGAPGRHTPGGSLVQHDDSMKGHGYWFDHAGLVASHRRNDRARSFLGLLRQSQLYEMFIQERLKLFATVEGGPEYSGDPFEQLVNSYLDNRSRRLAAHLGAGVRSSFSRFTAFVKKHRRTGSHASETSFGGNGFGSSRSGLTDSPEVQRVKQLAAAFASVAIGAGQLRRNIVDGDSPGSASPEPGQQAGGPHHRHTQSSIDNLADKISSNLDPSAFFEDDEEELDAEAADAAAAAAAAAGSNGRRGVSRNNSSSSLKDLVTGAASWTSGAAGNRAYRGTTGGVPEYQQQHLQQQGMGSPQSLARQSVPVGSSSPAAAAVAGAAAGGGATLARGSVPLIDLRESSPSSSSSSRPGSATPPMQPHASHFLQQQQQHLQQQQQQTMRTSLSSIADQLLGGSSSSAQGKPRSPAASMAATAGPGSAAATAAAASHRTSQHLHLKAALASIPAGPLPLPPQAKPRVSSSHLSLSGSVLGGGSALKPPLHQQQPLASPAAAAPAWDPFTELVSERSSSGLLSPHTGQQQEQPLLPVIPEPPVVQLAGQQGSSSGSESYVSKPVSSSRGTSSSTGGMQLDSSSSSGGSTKGLHFSSPGASPQQQVAEADLLHLEAIAMKSPVDLLDIVPVSAVDVTADSRLSYNSGHVRTSLQGVAVPVGGAGASDAGLAGLDELLASQTVSVARSDSLLDM